MRYLRAINRVAFLNNRPAKTVFKCFWKALYNIFFYLYQLDLYCAVFSQTVIKDKREKREMILFKLVVVTKMPQFLGILAPHTSFITRWTSKIQILILKYLHLLLTFCRWIFLACLNNVHGELLYYSPWRHLRRRSQMFYVKVLRSSLLPNPMMDLVHV